MNVTLPNGKVIRGVPEGTSKDDIARKAISAGLATESDFGIQTESPNTQSPEPEDKGFIDSIKDAFTGESRETRGTRELPELESAIAGGDASGFLSTLDPAKAFAVSSAIATTSDPEERAKIIKDAGNEFGIQYDEKGNIFAANNKTGQRVALNKPGLSASDLFPAFGQFAASLPLVASGGGPLAQFFKMAGKQAMVTSGMEALQASQGGDFNVENVALDSVMAGAGEAVPAIFRSASRSADDAASELSSRAMASESQRIQNPLSPEAQAYAARYQPDSKEASLSLAGSMSEKKPDLKKLAGDVSPSIDVIEAAERIGVADELTPGMISKSEAYRDIEGAIRAVGGNKISEQGNRAILSVSEKADELIEELGGDIDKAGMSFDIKDKISKTITDLDESVGSAYKKLDELVSPRDKVDMSGIRRTLQEEADNLGGIEHLEPFEKKILTMSKSKKPVNYALIDKERKSIGQALRNATGPYKDADSGRLKRMYGILTEAQGESLSGDALESWKAAKALTGQRKDLEERSITLFGKELSDALAPKAGRAVLGLQKGDYKKFNDLMTALPDKEARQRVMATALNDIFTQGSRKEKSLHIPGFVDWYESVKRSPETMRLIKENLPDGAMDRINDLATVSKSIRDANSRVVRTGVAAETLKGIEKAEGMLSKVINLGKSIATAEGVTTASGIPGAGTAGVIAGTIQSQGGKKAQEAVDNLISSHEFKRLAVELAKDNFSSSNAAKVAERAVLKSEKYKKWISYLPTEDQKAIARSGLIAWLGDE